MAEVKLPPSDIYFSQDSISNRFGKCTPHRFKFIGETLDDILQGKCEVYDIPSISVINKEGVWVTADNRRLWVFKKLQQFGECDEIIVTITSALSPKKDRVLPTITVRGPAGGTLWVKHEASKRREVTSSWHKHSSHFSIPLSLGSLSLTDRPDVRPFSDVSSVESLCSLSTLKESSDHGSNGKDRSSKYSVATAYSSNPTTDQRFYQSGIYSASKHSRLSQSDFEPYVPDYNLSTKHFDSPKQRITYRSYQAQEHTPTSLVDSVHTKYGYKSSHSYGTEHSKRAPEKENPQSLTIERRDKVVRLKPLDVGFAGDTGLFLAFDGSLYGEMMDKWCENLTKSWHVSMDVFMHKGKYYSVENEKLWKSQTLERFSGNVIISGRVVPKPFINYPIYGIHSFLISTDKISGGKWKSFVTLNGLPTKRSIKLDLSEILYTSTIQDTYQGKSIAGKLVELFTSGKRSHEVNVMEYENKYYTLENKKLWVLKHAEKVLGKFTITGHVKISMDYIMFHSFMTEGPCVGEVDVNLSRNHTHTAEEKFILKYIHQIEKRVD